jgi:predicted phage terminase large subunit-like protein
MNHFFKRLDKIESQLTIINSQFNFKNLPKKEDLLNDFLYFEKYFHKLRTGTEFRIDSPIGRKPFQIELAEIAEKVLKQEIIRVVVNTPPRYGKTEWGIYLTARGYAEFPNINNLYISYSHSLASLQTMRIRQVITLPEFREIFGVELSTISKAKDNFETTAGGMTFAAGTAGPITGRGAGIKNSDTFGGIAFIDDIHKPDEVYSSTCRDSIKRWWMSTFWSRVNDPKTAVVVIGQRVHEEDQFKHILEGYDTYTYEHVCIKALDDAGNALNPASHTVEKLIQLREADRHVFWAQYQQEPVPAGGSVYLRDDFYPLLPMTPTNIVSTFITVDTAETDKNYNDATAFSFWGLYQADNDGILSDVWCLHCLDSVEIRVQPRELQDEFMSFYQRCSMFSVKPVYIGIEKKSTGVTLLSTLKELKGLKVLDTCEYRMAEAGNRRSKIQRFVDVQSIVASHRITLTEGARHVEKFINHMSSITDNDAHAHDDIADTMVDAIQLALISQIIPKKNIIGKVPSVIPGYGDRMVGQIKW